MKVEKMAIVVILLFGFLSAENVHAAGGCCEIDRPNSDLCSGGPLTQGACENDFGGTWVPGKLCVNGKCEGKGVPAVSEWSLIIMTVLAFTGGTVLFGRRRRATAA